MEFGLPLRKVDARIEESLLQDRQGSVWENEIASRAFRIVTGLPRFTIGSNVACCGNGNCVIDPLA